jgi:hypothetical protein
MLRSAAGILVLIATTACSLIPQTTKNQVRGTIPPDADRKPLTYLHGNTDEFRARQITTEHSSVEYYDNFSLGILEVTDEGTVNPTQKRQVFDMLDQELENGGVLLVFVHGWHHGARTCDRDLCCFRTVLNTLKTARVKKYGKEFERENVVGVFIGWRGESIAVRRLNNVTIWDRKDVAETIGRGAAKELLQQISELWEPLKETVTMVSVGHSLGGALIFQAAKETLSGDVSDIENQNLDPFRVARADCRRDKAQEGNVKARRTGFGDLIILVNPALEASEYIPFDNDLLDRSKEGWNRKQLVEAKLPYDKGHPYPANQLPVLVAVASTADSAVGTIFPISRTLLFPFRPRVLFHSSERKGIGHYGPHVTHHLSYKEDFTEKDRIDRDPRQGARENCDCSMKTDEVPLPGRNDHSIDLAKTDQRQDFGGGDKYILEPTAARKERGWDVNSPYFVIEAEPKIVSEHSDIFNEYFVGFLTMFVDAYYQKFENEENRPCQYKAP